MFQVTTCCVRYLTDWYERGKTCRIRVYSLSKQKSHCLAWYRRFIPSTLRSKVQVYIYVAQKPLVWQTNLPFTFFETAHSVMLTLICNHPKLSSSRFHQFINHKPNKFWIPKKFRFIDHTPKKFHHSASIHRRFCWFRLHVAALCWTSSCPVTLA